MRVPATGGTLGNHVAEILAGGGSSVRVLARSVKVKPEWDAAGIEQVTGDFSDVASLHSAFDGVDRFFSVTPFVENLTELGMNAVTAAKKAGVSYIVRSSWMGAREKSNSLGLWHFNVERAVQESGIPYTILRPNTFMQSYLMNAESIRTANAFYMPQGLGRVSLVDVRDIAAVAAKCVAESGHRGATYELTAAHAFSNAEIAQKLTDLLGRKIAYVDVTPEQARESMNHAGLPGWMMECLLELYTLNIGLSRDSLGPCRADSPSTSKGS
jgi:uncharacterized protein YbjT (DUF2867 family)